MKAILKSIKPYWLYLILTGKKTVELNKNRPVSDDWNECVYLYCSKDLNSFKRIPPEHQAWMSNYFGRVSCSFWCGRIEEFHQFMLEPRNHYEREQLDNILQKSCVTYEELANYLKYRDYYKPFYLWYVTALERYDNPLELTDFCKNGGAPMRRPPESWCYVEV